MKKFTLFFMSLFLAVGVMAQEYLIKDKVTNVETGYYVVVGTFNPGNGSNTKTGPAYYEYSLGDCKYRLDADKKIAAGETLLDGNYVWYVVKNGTTITLKNVQDEVYFVRDNSRNQNFKGSEIANLTLQNATESKFFMHLADYTNIGYIHCNEPGGDPCLSYWNSHATSGSTAVRFEFFEVEVKQNEVEQLEKINDFYSVETSFGTYEGSIKDIINGDKSDKWWSNENQAVGKDITIVLNNVNQVGIIKWYFCDDGDQPQGATLERRAVAGGEWIKVADFTKDDIKNKIFTCTAAGADVKELRLRITENVAKWLQVAEVELFEYLDVDKTGLQELIAEAEGLFDPIVVPGKVVGDNIDIEGKISSNAAQNPADGNASTADKDGAGIAGLTDTNPETYFHSRWGGTAVNADHYLQIDLGENGKMSDFAFAYQTRKTGNANATSPAPLAIEVRVSADGSNFGKPIATFTKDRDGLPTHADLGQTLWNSGVLSATEDIRYIRLTVTDSKGPGNNTWNGHHFFAMGTLNLYSAKEGKVLSDSYKEYISDDLFKAYSDAINAAKAVNDDNVALPSDVNNAIEELAAQLDAVKNTIKDVLSYTLNVTNAGWATLYLGFNAEIPAEVEAYIVKGVKEGNWLDLVKVEGVLPANAGIIVKADADDYIFPYTADADEVVDVAGNLLKGTTKKTLIAKESGKAYYALGLVDGVVGFYNAVIGKEGDDNYKTNEFYNNAFKAYLEMPAASGSAAYYGFDWAGTTGIDEVKGESGSVKGEIYDLTGRRIEAITASGIYIVNGRKVLVK